MSTPKEGCGCWNHGNGQHWVCEKHRRANKKQKRCTCKWKKQVPDDPDCPIHGIDTMAEATRIARQVMELGSKIKSSDINWNHPKFKKAIEENEKFKRFMGWTR